LPLGGEAALPRGTAHRRKVSSANFLQYAIFVVIVVASVRPVGTYLFRVFDGQKTSLDRVLRPIERYIYRVAGIDPRSEMDWKEYTIAFVVFGFVGTALLFVILLLQQRLPWFYSDYQNTPMTVDLALNTAISFATTTTWQAYAGETTMSYFSQMVGLTAQNFLAGAAGLAVGIAFIRGLARRQTEKLGNFWVDLTRAILWVLLPLSIVGGLILVWQGVPINFNPYTKVRTLEGVTQIIAQGPVAALESIKNLGTNGGGFFNVNGAHPYENPTPLTNLLEMLMIAVLPASLTYTFGRMIGRPRQGWTIFWVMTFLFGVGLVTTGWAEQSGNPRIAALGLDTRASSLQPGGNMEGKEVRFGIHGSVLAAVTTSNGATGSYNSMHDSYTPIGGMVPLVNMLAGEITYGGLGSGLYSMVMLVLVSVFIGGLMVGHTPQYLGKQLTVRETRLIGSYMVIGMATALPLTALAVATNAGRAGLVTNQGAHGLSEMLFAYASSLANNGQNFAGLNANSVFYNLTTAIAMLVGRFGLGALALALTGSFAKQGIKPESEGTLPTDSVTFAILLTGTILILAGLSYFPALSLGPIIEHLLMVH
jgi:K+-transporting ATPase ATPase A chain